MQVSMFGDFVRLLVGYVRMMGNWLVFQLLMCESAMQTCETSCMYVCMYVAKVSLIPSSKLLCSKLCLMPG